MASPETGRLVALYMISFLCWHTHGADPSITVPILPYSITIDEGDVNALLLDITATDTDGDLNSFDIDPAASPTITSTFMLTLQSGGSGSSRTKTLSLQTALDYETDQRHLIPIKLTDSTHATVTTTFTIVVADLIDEVPTFGNAPYIVPIDETSVTGTSVLDVASDVTDNDSGDTLTYSLSGTDSNMFRIDPTSGILYTAQKLDYDAGDVSFPSLVIQVTDSNSNTATAQLDITITDLNDEPPSCSPSVYVVNSIDENEAANTLVETIACTDEDDTTAYKTLNYRVNSGDDTAEKFALGLTDGLLKTTSTALDAETKDRYELKILVTDNPGSSIINTATVTVIVQVGHLNDNSPVWTMAPAAQTIAESASVGTTLMTVAASDADAGATDGMVAYALVSAVGDDGATTDVSSLFQVDTWGGQVTTAGVLDAEGGSDGINTYTLTISATDQGTSSNSISASMAVTLTDVNEFTPQFAQSLHTASVTEGSAIDTSVLDLSAVTDGDRDAPTLTYAFASATDYFKFHASNANEIDTKIEIDLDTGASHPDSYTLLCEVNDGGKTSTTTVIISVTSSNDHDPTFVSQNPVSVNVPEDSSVSHSVATVTFTDDDAGTDGDITFQKGTGDSNNYFQVDASTGVIRLQKTLDFDTLSDEEFDLEILAVDGGARTGSTTVTVTVTDVSDELPVCSPGTHTVTVAETENVAFTVATVTCSDADAVDSPTYSITSGDSGNAFTVHSTTGVITLARALDYDSATQDYQLEITYSDDTNYVIVQVAVTVGAVNEDTPTFSNAPYSVTKTESISVGSAIYTMSAADGDYAPHNVISYVFDGSSSGAENFAMVQETGAITLAKGLDYETDTSHSLVVTATDGGGLTSQATLIVTVSNDNDNAPLCSPLADAVAQTEGDYSSGAVTLVTITCNDGDGDSLTYTLAQNPNENAFSNTNGAIQATGTLDFEGTQFYELTLTVWDGTYSTTAEVAVTVTADNEGGPAFSSATLAASVAESASLGHIVGTYLATDPDLGTHPHGKLIYDITTGNTAGAFLVDSSSGEITVAAALDFESNPSYTLSLQVDEEAGTNSDTATLTITITDVDDVAPTCTTGAFSVSVAENVFSGSAYTVSSVSLGCSDVDTSTLMYAITSGDTSVFSITTTGALQITSFLDFDSGTRQYDLKLSVMDGTAPALTIPGTVTVSGINEAPPAFTQSTYTSSTSESTAIGSSISAVTANDDDSADTADGQVSYAFSGTSPSEFLIAETTGDITLKTELDYETDVQHVFEVEATDGTSTATATVTITVVDANDNTPVFQMPFYSGSVAENAAGSTTVVTVQATDEDDPLVNDNGLVAYSIYSGDSSGVFSIDSSTGAITVSGSQTVDYETTTQYNLVVYAQDGGSGANTASVNVLITVTPDNEATPTFSPSTYTVSSKDESLGVGNIMTTVTATDADRSTNRHGMFQYSMNSHANFYLDSASGAIRVKSALDYESDPSYTLTVYAIDSNGDSDAKTGVCTVQINLQDINDITPSCALSSNVHTYAEDVVISSTDILDLSSDCTDGEASPNGDLSYAITSVNGAAGNGIFALGAATGVLTFASQPNFETATEYILLITVTDGGTNALATTVGVTLTITDVNEGTPSFTGQQSSLSIAESTAVGTSIIAIVATDTDTADTLTYTMTSSEFVIDAYTGVMRTTAVLDREMMSSYSLNIVATDDNSVNTLRSATHAFTITITDVNDVTPHFNPASYSVTIAEDASVGDQLTTVTATDEDSGSSGMVAYALSSSSNPGTVFGVDSSTGDLTVLSALDYEMLTSFALEVTATDGTTTSTTTVNVVVEPINEDPPMFSPASPTFSVSEDTAVTTSIGAITATDADAGTDGIFSYSIVSGSAGKFSVDPFNGDLILIDSLDYENMTSYTVTVRAIDKGTNPSSLSSDATVMISVTDVNDNTPVCNPVTYRETVPEDGTSGDAVLTVICTDADTTAGFNAITYAIQSGNDDGQFDLGSSSGQITLNSSVALDYYITSTYTLVVTATDAASHQDTITVTLLVSGADPSITVPNLPYSITIDEGDVNALSLDITATDTDGDLNSFDIDPAASSTITSTFMLTSQSGGSGSSRTKTLSLQTALDYETDQRHLIPIELTDSTSATVTTTFTIVVADLIDEVPTFGSAPNSVTIDETSVTGTSVLDVAVYVTDSDSGDTLTYSLSGTDSNMFRIDPTSGILYTAQKLDYDAGDVSFPSLVIHVTDSNSNTATAQLDITITDLNDEPPSCSPSVYVVNSIDENEAANTLVETVACTDEDDTTAYKTLNYLVNSGDDTAEKFALGLTDGLLKTTSTALDADTKDRYELEILVTDNPGSSPINTATVTVIVQVGHLNDNSPVWTMAPAAQTIAESASVGTTLMTVAASDADAGATDGMVAYALVSAVGDDGATTDVSSLFQVDTWGGQVTTAGVLDAEGGSDGINTYTLTISATDQGTSSNSISASMAVTLTDVNEFTPQFAQSLHTASVTEGSAIDTSVLDLSAVTDGDRDAPTLTYAFASATDYFKFHASNANEIDTKIEIDLDTGASHPDSYTLLCEVDDGGKTSTTTVIISVTSSNDHDPTFVSQNPVSVNVPEDSSVSHSVATVTFADDDAGTDGDITFQKGTGDSSNYFQVDASTGVIRLQKTVDFDTLSDEEFDLEILAVDGGARTGSTTVTVTVTDVSDELPVCSPGTHTVTVAETENAAFTVATVTCSDADAVDSPTYSITGGDSGNAFTVHSTTGVITLASALDYDSATQDYQLEITYSDGTNNVIVQVAVTVGAVNEDTPTFSNAPYSVTKTESISVGSAIYTMSAADGDYAPHNVISYVFHGSSSGAENFAMVQETGAITLAKGLDYETDTSHTLVVTATDGGGLTDQATLTVTVSNANDNAPSCSPLADAVDQAEGDYSSGAATLVTITCTDADADSLTYTLAQNPNEIAFSNTNGAIQATGTLDFEGTQFYELTLTVWDGTYTTTAEVAVTVTAVNEGGPAFSSATLAASVAESASLGHTVGTYAATDPDLGTHPHGKLIYDITSGNNGAFLVDSSSGEITVAAALDFESNPSYTLSLKVDEEAGTNSDTATLTITITDVDDVAPTCTTGAFSVSVAESVFSGSAYTVSSVSLGCSDVDTSTLTYAITSGDTFVFSITTAGALQITSILDFDSGTRQYDLELSVTDNTAPALVIPGTVTVTGVNEAPPAFTQSTYTPSTSESTAIGSSISAVTANDDDSADTADGQVSYAFSGTPPSEFLISETTGDITLKTELDYETDIQHVFEVEATDGTNTATATVTITVVDANDNTPVFVMGSYSGSVAENAAGSTTVVTVQATDEDDPSVNDNGLVAYSIYSGDSSGVFSIDSSTGAITVSGSQAVDYETTTQYNLVVYAQDGGSGANTASVNVLITVTPDNEATPTFSPSTYTVSSKDESLGVGDIVTTVTATDADRSTHKHGVFQYSMNSHANFYLDSASGAIRVKSALDYETDPSYTLTVYAIDSDGDSDAKTGVCTVQINLQDINDITPSCALSSNVHTYAEDVVISSTDILDLSSDCTDGEASSNGALSYAITSVNGAAGTGIFALGAATGVLTFASQPNFETATEYILLITVTDGGTNALATTVEVTVTITDVNEGTPSFTGQQSSLSIAESTAVGTSIIAIVATDTDTADTLTYTMTSSEFVIDADTGVMRTTAVLDREMMSSYSLNIVATDDNSVNTLRSATHAFTITITDVNDVTPHFNPASYSVTIAEDASVGDQLTTVTATDEDSGSSGTVAYALSSSSNPGTVFGVDSSTGALTVQSALDYETLTSFDLEVTATDGTTTSTTTVNVVVEPINEDPPTFSPASPTFSVSEDTAVTTSIGAVTATDADAGTDGAFSYIIVSGSDGRFSVDPSNGDLTLIASLDYESTMSYTVTVRAIDEGTNPSSLSSDATVIISVTDVNDNTPVCNPVTYSETVAEDGTSGDAVLTVTCTDADMTAGFNAITYAIQSGNGDAHFDLGTNSGQITLSSHVALDYESSTTTYTLVVTATDAASQKGSATVTLLVSGVNEADPAYTSGSYTPSMGEDAAVNDVVATIAATDADHGADGDVTYHIISGNDEGHFNLDLYSGVLTVVDALDYETTSSYSLVVHTIDGGASARTAITTVAVSVNDLNDNAPSCGTALFAVTLPENSVVSTAVVAGTAMGCSDADASPNGDLGYSLDTTSNVNSAFAVDAVGDVTVNSQAALDIETTASWTLLVLVRDSATISSDRLTTTVIIVVTLTDVNEAAPAFTPGNSYTASVAEDASAGTSVTTVQATDSDHGINGDVTYSITAGNGDSKFRVSTTSGVVSTQDTLDREDTASYSLTITATDGGGSSTTATLAITVTDVNDETPACAGSPYAMSVAEDASISDTVGSVSGCTDDDLDTNNVLLVYSIVSGDANNHLDIDSATGLINVNAALDYETTMVYYLIVEVKDSGASVLTGTAYVTVDVTSVNEYDPVITELGSGLTASVAEDASVGTSVLTIAATDTDDPSHADGQIRFSITAGNTQNHFVIDQLSGEVSVSGALDREATPSYSLTIRATDSTSGSGSERTDEETLTITVTDVNDNYPVFTPSAYSVSVLESATVGATVAQVTTTDDDSGANAVASYSIVSGNSDGKFSMTGDEILLASSVDYETTPQYSLFIEAADPSLSSTAVIVINIESVNEYDPVLDTSMTSVTVAEDIAIGASIYQAVATDQDNGDYGSVVYAITNGNPGDSVFAIDVTSGNVTVSSYLDYDTAPQSYTLEITASDNNDVTSLRTDVITVTVTLTDVNDNPPVFTHNTYSQVITEDTPGVTSVLSVAASDADASVNADVTYAIVSGDGVGKFTIDSATGQIDTVSAPNLDFETKTSYTLHVSATDGGAPALSSACTVLITLTDVNDNEPVFDQVTWTTTLAENQAAGVSLAQLAATDADNGVNAALTFSIDTATDPTGVFALVSLGATTVRLETAAMLDRETTGSYTLEVLAVDGAGVPLTGTATVLVTVTDENDQTPAFTSLSYAATITEDTSIGTSVLQVAASDADDGNTVNAELRFSIVSGNSNNSFTLDAVTGVLRVADTLDREAAAEYSLQLEVTDQGVLPDSSTVTAVVTLTDVNDNPPVFAGPYYMSVAENVPNNTLVGTIAATDADTGLNAVIYYSLVATSVGPQDHFWVQTDTGNVYANTDNLDRESVASYLLVVRAQNDGSPLRYDDTEVNVTVTDVNDIIPLLDQASYAVNLFENAPVGTFVLAVTGADNDLAQNMVLTYSMQGSQAQSSLTLDGATGIFTLAAIPDRETVASITFTVYATDNGSPPLEDYSPVTVYFDDVNDNMPVFSKSFYTTEISHDDYLDGRTILTVLATDADEGDNALVHYTVLEPANEFMIDSDTGELSRSAAYLDPHAAYVFTVQGQDTAVSPLASSTTVRIDTFPASVVLVELVLEMSEAEFLSQQAAFENALESYLTTYPNIEVHVYKVVDNSASATGRRRLLNTNTITVSLYALEDGQMNATSAKVFLSDTELLGLLQGTGTSPADFLTGATFAAYGITAVRDPDPDPEEDTRPWGQTQEGLTVIISCTLILLIVLSVVVVATVWCYCRRKNVPITTVKPTRTTTEVPKPLPKKNLPPPIIVLPEVGESAVQRNRPPTLEGVYRNKALWRTENEVKKRPPRGRDPIPRDSPPPPSIENRQFDGRAFDPASGRVYEYNTKTNERRWLTSSTGSRTPPPDYDS